ncbi:MAG: hypothetical protein IPO93_05260 [Actinobacteria bacterium]|nr:hypothetical protein [Actinomycetota bacterium]
MTIPRRPLQPILVVLVYRGGARFVRALKSIDASEHHFRRIIISVTGPHTGNDMQTVERYMRERAEAGNPSKLELICSGVELPTMEHQKFWIDYVERTGGRGNDWIYWLAYDDEVRARGLDDLVDADGNWPLTPGTAYFGPWAMRHEKAELLYDGPRDAPLESWTSFPVPGPTRLPVAEWVAEQLRQPTYMQMSGSVVSFRSHQRLAKTVLHKRGPMRIEMATAADPDNLFVAEFPDPLCIIYGRPNSDRASYGKSARIEDFQLAAWLARYTSRHPSAFPVITRGMGHVATAYAKMAATRSALPPEEWRVRGVTSP